MGLNSIISLRIKPIVVLFVNPIQGVLPLWVSTIWMMWTVVLFMITLLCSLTLSLKFCSSSFSIVVSIHISYFTRTESSIIYCEMFLVLKMEFDIKNLYLCHKFYWSICYHKSLYGLYVSSMGTGSATGTAMCVLGTQNTYPKLYFLKNWMFVQHGYVLGTFVGMLGRKYIFFVQISRF